MITDGKYIVKHIPSDLNLGNFEWLDQGQQTPREVEIKSGIGMYWWLLLFSFKPCQLKNMSWQREKEVVSLMLCQVLDPTRHGLMVKLQSCSVLMLLLWLLLWLWLLFLLLLLVEDRWLCMCLNDGRTYDYLCSLCTLISTQYLFVHDASIHWENRFCSHDHNERIGHVEKTQHFLVTCCQGIGCKCGLIEDSDGKKNGQNTVFCLVDAWMICWWNIGKITELAVDPIPNIQLSWPGIQPRKSTAPRDKVPNGVEMTPSSRMGQKESWNPPKVFSEAVWGGGASKHLQDYKLLGRLGLWTPRSDTGLKIRIY